MDVFSKWQMNIILEKEQMSCRGDLVALHRCHQS